MFWVKRTVAINSNSKGKGFPSGIVLLQPAGKFLKCFGRFRHFRCPFSFSGGTTSGEIFMPDNVIKTVPEIIKAASGTNLGILALLILVLALFGFYFFRKTGAGYQFLVFLVMFCGVSAFGYAAITVQRDATIRNPLATVAIPDLRLSLLFMGPLAANPSRAHVTAYVEKKASGKREARPDIVGHPGPGGMYLDFTNLSVGDIISVEVEDQGKKWQSFDMPMLQANLQMNLQEQ
jgi:hypothetical protein